MKKYIIEHLANKSSTLSIAFINGKSHTFCAVVDEMPESPNLIELKLSDEQYVVLVNIDQVCYINHRS